MEQNGDVWLGKEMPKQKVHKSVGNVNEKCNMGEKKCG